MIGFWQRVPMRSGLFCNAKNISVRPQGQKLPCCSVQAGIKGKSLSIRGTSAELGNPPGSMFLDEI